MRHVKGKKMIRTYSLMYIPLIILMCMNFGSKETTVDGADKPDYNFMGVLIDTNGDTCNVQNITISGMYKQIHVYKVPQDKPFNPNDNIIKLDLSEIKVIGGSHNKEVLNFQGRDYFQITVTFKGEENAQHYIIESFKTIKCDEVRKAGPIEKELSFRALDYLTLTSYKLADPIEKDKKRKKDADAEVSLDEPALKRSKTK